MIVDYFDTVYSSINGRSPFATKLKIYSFFRWLIRVVANIVIPISFLLNRRKYCLKITSTTKKEKLIVSLTSFPKRINRLWIVIESIFRQSIKPDMVILWLSKEQFPDRSFIPNSLLSLEKRGLIIELCEGDLRSHKKYYYALRQYPNDIIITIDDDVIYATDLILNLLNQHQKYPNAICCTCASRIGIEDNKILPYISWECIDYEIPPSFGVLAIGVGGVLYPPGSLYHMFGEEDIFMKYCPTADDLWLNMMAHLKNTPISKTAYRSNYLLIIRFSKVSLSSVNNGMGANDIQLNRLITYFSLRLNQFPYSMLAK